MTAEIKGEVERHTALQVGLSLNAIAALVTDDDLKKIKPHLERIESAVYALATMERGKDD